MGRRALSDEEKDSKKLEIMDAAFQLFREMPFPVLTMAHIAARAGVAKGTLYLYFRTKEELFLHILLHHLQAWFGEFAQVLQVLPTRMHPRDLAALLAKAAADRPDLARLIALLHGVLEQNISVEQAREFKRQLLQYSVGFGERLEQIYPMFQPGDGLHFCLYYYSIVVGVFQMSNPAPDVAKALDTPELRVMLIDFESHLAGLLTALLAGWWVGGAPHKPVTSFLQPPDGKLTESP